LFVEDDMAEKPPTPRPQQKRHPADRLTGGTSKKNQIELTEEDLAKISGGCPLKIGFQR
jgi:bacteriocin-like protein